MLSIKSPLDPLIIYFTSTLLTWAKKNPQMIVIEQQSLSWYKIIQKVRWPSYTYSFTLNWILASDVDALVTSLWVVDYACNLTYSKVNFWLTTNTKWYIKITNIDDSAYMSQDITSASRLVDFSFDFTPFL